MFSHEFSYRDLENIFCCKLLLSIRKNDMGIQRKKI